MGAQHKGNSSRKIPCSPPAFVGPEHFTWGLSSRGGWALCLQLSNYNFTRGAQDSPRTQPSHWTGYNSREHSWVERENGGVVHQQKKMSSRFRCPLVASPSAPAKKNWGKKTLKICLVSRAVSFNALCVLLSCPHPGGSTRGAALQDCGWRQCCCPRALSSSGTLPCWQSSSFCL